MPQVSIVVPIYNSASYLQKALDSILSQTFSDFELLLLNDGSSDQSAAIAAKTASRDRRVVFVDGDHQGVVFQRNRGLELAQAPLIAMMDADDIARPDRLTKQVQFMAMNHDCVALGGQAMRIDCDDLPIDQWRVPLEHEQIDGEHLAGRPGAIINPTVIMRTSAVERAGGYPSGYDWGAEDYCLFLRLAEVGRLANLPDILLNYRLHPGSLTFAGAKRQRELIRISLEKTWQRRGLAGIPSVPEIRTFSENELMWNWATNAFASRNFAAARSQSFKLLRQHPFKPRCWILFLAAMLGPISYQLKRIIPYRVGPYNSETSDRRISDADRQNQELTRQ